MKPRKTKNVRKLRRPKPSKVIKPAIVRGWYCQNELRVRELKTEWGFRKNTIRKLEEELSEVIGARKKLVLAKTEKEKKSIFDSLESKIKDSGDASKSERYKKWREYIREIKKVGDALDESRERRLALVDMFLQTPEGMEIKHNILKWVEGMFKEKKLDEAVETLQRMSSQQKHSLETRVKLVVGGREIIKKRREGVVV